MHKGAINDKVKLLESYLAPADFELNGQQVKQGTWMMAVKVLDDALWQAVKSGELTGFSIGGSAVRRPDAEATAKQTLLG
jgi:DNA adenine methylase